MGGPGTPPASRRRVAGRAAGAGGGDDAAGVELWGTASKGARGGGAAEASGIQVESPRALGRASTLARDSAARLWGRRVHQGAGSEHEEEEEAGPGSGRTFFVRNVAQREIEVGEKEWRGLIARQDRRLRQQAMRQGLAPRDSLAPALGTFRSPSNLWGSMKDWSWVQKQSLAGAAQKSSASEPSSAREKPTQNMQNVQSDPPCSPLAGGTPSEVAVVDSDSEGEGALAPPPLPSGEALEAPGGDAASDRSSVLLPAAGGAEFVHVRQWPIIDVLSPYCWQYVVWQYSMMLLDFTYTAFFVPYAVVFFLEDCQWTSPSAMIDFAAGWLYVADVVINLRVGYSVVYKFSRRLELGGWRAALFYMRHGTFIVDLPATIPVFVQIGCLCAPAADTSFALNILQFMRLLRLLRLYRPFRLMASDALDAAAANLKLPQALVSCLPLLQITILYAFIAHLMACTWWFTAVLEDSNWAGEPPTFDSSSGDGSNQLYQCRRNVLSCTVTGDNCISWADQAGVACQGDGAKYTLALFFASMTITTVGYGTASGVTTAEYAVACVLMFIGTLFFGYIVSTTTLILEKVSTKRRELEEFHDKIRVIKAWGKGRNLPRKLTKRIYNYYAMVWTRRGSMQEEMMIWEELPFPLKASAAISITSSLLSRVPSLSFLSAEAWKHVAGRLQPVWKPPGEFVAHPPGRGDGVKLMLDLDSFCFLEKGSVACLRKGSQVFRIEGPQVFGLSRALTTVLPDIKLEAGTVGFMSVTPVWLWTVPIEYLIEYLEDNPGQMAAVCEGVAADPTQVNLLGLDERDLAMLREGAERLRASSFAKAQKNWSRGRGRQATFGSRQFLRAAFEDEVAANTGNKQIPKVA